MFLKLNSLRFPENDRVPRSMCLEYQTRFFTARAVILVIDRNRQQHQFWLGYTPQESKLRYDRDLWHPKFHEIGSQEIYVDPVVLTNCFVFGVPCFLFLSSHELRTHRVCDPGKELGSLRKQIRFVCSSRCGCPIPPIRSLQLQVTFCGHHRSVFENFHL